MSAKNTNVTPADVVAKAAEEKLVTVVPAQGEKTEQVTDDALVIELTVKKTLKERLAAVGEQLKEHKKVVVAVGAAAGFAALAFARYAKKQVEENLVVVEVEDTEDVVTETVPTDQPAA